MRGIGLFVLNEIPKQPPRSADDLGEVCPSFGYVDRKKVILTGYAIETGIRGARPITLLRCLCSSKRRGILLARSTQEGELPADRVHISAYVE